MGLDWGKPSRPEKNVNKVIDTEKITTGTRRPRDQSDRSGELLGDTREPKLPK